MWIHGSSTPGALANWGVQGVPSPTNVPPSVYEPCEWTDLNGNFWLFGGFGNSGPNTRHYAALWKYNPVTNQWTWMKGPNTSSTFVGNFGVQGVPAPTNLPPTLYGGSATWVDAQGNLWLLGGAGVGHVWSDLWKYEINSNMWTWMKGPGIGDQPGVYGTQTIPNAANNPGARGECAATWTDNLGDLWLFGGMGNGS